MTVKKIISGGQNGIDLFALEIARELNISTGGTAPKFFMTEKGPNNNLANYGLKECEIEGYPPRTAKNVQDSDGTLIFGTTTSRGYILTTHMCKLYEKPFKVNPTIEEMKEFCKDKEVINIAGNRASKISPAMMIYYKNIIRKGLEV